MNTVFSRTIPHVLSAGLLAMAATLSSFAVTASPAQAAARGSYVATLSAPLAADRQEIIDGALWKCAGDRCAAPAQGGRPVFICAKVAGKFGAVASFASPAGPLAENDVARCNAMK